MKGNIKLTVEVKDETGNFPVTETYTIARDNTYEALDGWVAAFKKILYCVGFDDGTIKEVFDEEEV